MVTLELACSFHGEWNGLFQQNDFKGTEGCFSIFEAEGYGNCKCRWDF